MPANDGRSKEDWINARAAELWDRQGRKPEFEQSCWDKAVEEFEAGTAEDERGPARPDPAVDQGNEQVHKP